VVCDIVGGLAVPGDLRVKVDFRKDAVVRQLDALKGAEKRAILKRGLNRAAVTVRAKGAREIANKVGGKVTVAQIKRAIRVKSATVADLSALVTAFGRGRLSLTYFSPRQTKRGVRVTIYGKTIDIAHAFRATTKSGHKGVWIRAENSKPQMYYAAKYYPETKRLPIAELFAPGIPDEFVNEEVMGVMRAVGEVRFRQVVEQEYKYLIARTSAT
jgi:hypothetical protein